MSLDDRTRERIRWHCRRGMLELDLVLNAFIDRHLADLAPAGLNAFETLLERTDPELLELVMGREEGDTGDERAVLALVRDAACNDYNIQTG